jgi:outer membrane receptor protein involved in Fe transport
MKLTLITQFKFQRGLLVMAMVATSTLFGGLSGQELHPMGVNTQPVEDSAVEDITNKPEGLDDLFSNSSPFHFGLTAGETYDDNIFISPVKTADFVTHVTPSIDFEQGDRTAAHSNYLNLFFDSTLFFYKNNSEQNRQDYDANVYYQYQWTRLTLGICQQYQHLTDTNIDIGNFATRDIYTTGLNGSYVYNDKLTIIGSATQQITSYATGSNVDTNEWTVDGYALYQVTPKLSLGGGPQVTFIDVSGAPNESHQDILLHANYNPGGKITATLTAGMEYLQYQDNINPGHLLPIFNLTANYSPTDATQFTFSASRQTNISYDLLGQTYLSTAVQVGVRQRMMEDVYFTVSGSYDMTDYRFGSEQFVGTRRKDNYFSAEVGVEWDPKPWLKATASYVRSQDDSNSEQNTFNDNQININAGVSF